MQRKFYHYGYRMIDPQGEEQDWEYVIQVHRNQNGRHFDVRLAKPGEGHAYSWATRKLPYNAVEAPALARRTHDHSLHHMDFEGPLKTAKGEGTVKIIARGQATMKEIDEKKGLTFKLDNGMQFNLQNLQGKKYILKRQE